MSEAQVRAFLESKCGDVRLWPSRIDTVISTAINNNISHDVLLQICLNKIPQQDIIRKISLSAKNNSHEISKVKHVLATNMQKQAIDSIVVTGIKDSFQPYIACSIILHHKEIPTDFSRLTIASGALKAISQNPDFIEGYAPLIREYFNDLSIDDIISAAISSKEGMRFILSTVVPRIADGDSRSVEIIQKISVSPKGEPALLVAKDIQNKLGISCLLTTK